MEKTDRPIVLSIAGFDPSAGAGTLADIKTFEAVGVYGTAVLTALTLQTEHTFEYLKWRTIKSITEEITFLTKAYPIQYAKIGITRDVEMLQEIVYHLHKKNINIIWDPVIISSTHKRIFNKNTLPQVKDLLKNIFCITPNLEEALLLSGKTNLMETGSYLSQFTNVIIKGGHNTEEKGIDYLFYHNNQFEKINPQTSLNIYPKHGSGCVYSSALTAYLARNYSLEQSVQLAKEYTEKFLASGFTLLGYHYTWTTKK